MNTNTKARFALSRPARNVVRAIVADMMLGFIEPPIRSFSELYSQIDATQYLMDAMPPSVPRNNRAENAFMFKVAAEVDAWIKSLPAHANVKRIKEFRPLV